MTAMNEPRTAYAQSERDGMHQLTAAANTPFNVELNAVDPGLLLAEHIRAHYAAQHLFEDSDLTSFDQFIFYLFLMDFRQCERQGGALRLFVFADLDHIAGKAKASKSGVKNAVRRLLDHQLIEQVWTTGKDRYFEIVNRTPRGRLGTEPLQNKDLIGHVVSSESLRGRSIGHQVADGHHVADRSATTCPLVGNVRGDSENLSICINANANAIALQCSEQPARPQKDEEEKQEMIDLLVGEGFDYPVACRRVETPECTIAKMRNVIARADEKEASTPPGQKPFKTSRQAFITFGLQKKGFLPPLGPHEKRAEAESRQRTEEAAQLRARQRRIAAAAAQEEQRRKIAAARNEPDPLARMQAVKSPAADSTMTPEQFARDMREILQKSTISGGKS